MNRATRNSAAPSQDPKVSEDAREAVTGALPAVSVIMPVLNEERHLRPTRRAARPPG